jgi:hypothetical protein
VFSPTLFTLIIQYPEHIIVPLYNEFLLFGFTIYFSLYTSFDSPLIVDSSTLTEPSMIIPSAGTISPSSNITISSTTTSLIGISIFLSSLITLQLIFDTSSCNFSNDF